MAIDNDTLSRTVAPKVEGRHEEVFERALRPRVARLATAARWSASSACRMPASRPRTRMDRTEGRVEGGHGGPLTSAARPGATSPARLPAQARLRVAGVRMLRM